MKPELILGNQLRQYSETTQARKWGNNHWQPLKDEPPALWQKRFFVVAD
ncbi:TPA: hypothetical protein N6L97_004287 [Escherichia coli]|nr:hypothetical protein [Escherichia coli]